MTTFLKSVKKSGFVRMHRVRLGLHPTRFNFDAIGLCYSFQFFLTYLEAVIKLNLKFINMIFFVYLAYETVFTSGGDTGVTVRFAPWLRTLAGTKNRLTLHHNSILLFEIDLIWIVIEIFITYYCLITLCFEYLTHFLIVF